MLKSTSRFANLRLVLCHLSADGCYALGVGLWKVKAPGGCYEKALSGDIDCLGASGFAEASQRGQGGRAEACASADSVAGRSGGRRVRQIGFGDCRVVGVWASQCRAGSKAIRGGRSGSSIEPQAEPAGVRAEDGWQNRGAFDRSGMRNTT